MWIKNKSAIDCERMRNEFTDKTAECEINKNESVLEYERIRNELRDKTAECEWIRN